MNYQDYLRSPLWKRLRQQARQRAGNVCELCRRGAADHVHHVKYPKRFEDDHIDNLVVACEDCHDRLHGIRAKKMNEIVKFGEFMFPGTGQKYQVDVFKSPQNDMYLFYSLDQVMEIICQEQDAHFNVYKPLTTRGNQGRNAFYAKVEAILEKDELFDVIENGKPVRYVLEPGLYRLLGKLDTPICERFQYWLYYEVLPAIRKTGRYEDAATQQADKQGLELTRQMIGQIIQMATAMGQHNSELIELNTWKEGAEKKFEVADKKFDVIEKSILRWNQIQEENLISTADYIRKKKINDFTENKIGLMAAKYARQLGAIRTEQGWRGRDGTIVSNTYPAPGTQYSSINKWLEKFLDWVVKKMRKEISLA